MRPSSRPPPEQQSTSPLQPPGQWEESATTNSPNPEPEPRPTPQGKAKAMASRHTNRTTTGKQQLDVLVVGAGPTGLTLTAQLQAVGATCRIVDRQLDRTHESRALAVQPRTLEILRGLGVAQELVARGNDAVRVELHAGGRVVPVRLFGLGLDDTSFPFLLFVSQAETEAVLNDHLAARGVPVERGVELVAFQADQNGVTCTLRCADGQTEQARARYLVGCDGAGIPFVGGAYPQTFTLADLLPAPAPPRDPLLGRPRLLGRRRRPRPQPSRRAGHEHRHPGSLEPGLEARPGHPRAGRGGAARLLRHRTPPGRPLGGPVH